ncbi:UbiA family prenyltransferase [Phormidium tenue FACHB-886]|nr:UbiA family prenyltransferase [Phormidium tenue FACHB-886]
MNLKRWWSYQEERFPVVQNSILILVFSSSAVCYSLRLRGATIRLSEVLPAILVAFFTLFLFFLQLRITDEFKDYQDDATYRPYRPVPRGLVSLRELGVLGVAGGIVQLGFASAIGSPMVLLLLLVWGYLGLMSQEFFVSRWLKAHPLVYMLSHAVILPLMALYATAWDWLVAQEAPSMSLGWFMGVSFFTSLAIELGRKIRAPKDEEFGVETYSALWGRRRAAIVWLSVVGLMGLTTLLSARSIQFNVPIALMLLALLVGSVLVIWQFLVKSTSTQARAFEFMSALWILLVYPTLGIAPLFIQ